MVTEKILMELSNDKVRLFVFLENNIGGLFSTPNITKYYKIIKDVDITDANIMVKVIYAWFAFLSGDHVKCFKIMNAVTETSLDSAEVSSLFYALKALMSSMVNINDALRYALIAVDVLPLDDKSIFLANAYLTLGQLYSGTDKYQIAAEKFAESFKLFYNLDLQFLASIAFTNEVLNLYKLGEFTDVLKKCTELLIMTESFIDDNSFICNIINLPMGMCYYELNKPLLAIEYLEKAKKCIDTLELFHMYGLTEIYLFKSYLLLDNVQGMKKNLLNCDNKFSKMHHINLNLVLFMFKIYMYKYINDDIKPIIDKIEIEYLNSQNNLSNFITELLVYLKLNNLSDTITINDLLDKLSYYEEVKNIPIIQQTHIQLAEIYYIENKHEEVIFHLQKAYNIYKKYKIAANFCLFPLKSISFLKQMDNKLYNNLKKSHIEKKGVLSEREKDIMKLIASGKTNADISKELYISVGTIKWYINQIFSKLDVKNRVQAIEKAKELNEI